MNPNILIAIHKLYNLPNIYADRGLPRINDQIYEVSEDLTKLEFYLSNLKLLEQHLKSLFLKSKCFTLMHCLKICYGSLT